MLGCGILRLASWLSEFIYAPDLLRTIVFADEYFRDDVLSGGDQNTYMRISRRDDRISSCNHDMDLVIGIALMFY